MGGGAKDKIQTSAIKIILENQELLASSKEKISSMLDFSTQEIIKECKMLPFFCFYDAIKPFLNIATQIHYMDTKDITTKDKTFHTMSLVAKILGIPFENQVDDFDVNYSGINIPKIFFPYTTTIPLQTKHIQTTSPTITISFYTNPDNISDKQLALKYVLENGLKIYAGYPKDNLADLENNQGKIDEKIKIIEEKYTLIEAFIKNDGLEKLILKVFKHSPELKNHFQAFLKPKIAPIAQDSPHIVQNWIYYQDFLKL
ncbi:DUF2972 domain-containing protein [Helicobacter sp. 11S02596-1]|uniref:DUF2972 domain-containing protein n=1 Tax=Helicobacter sp. 11S02596-1 TaxID=1476194 RepID=UPI000BA6F623|nr:DUF2972 domain-containing protein [Helicobacter sp. 11S02596-1]PAF45181.1 hypothetical protein BJI48_01040 [Helicobacter sp. 11S02596-1]